MIPFWRFALGFTIALFTGQIASHLLRGNNYIESTIALCIGCILVHFIIRTP